MILNFAIFAVLAASIVADQVPVLTHFGQGLVTPSPVGKIIGQGDFLTEIKEHLNQNLNLIVIDQLKTQDLAFAVRKADLKPNVDLKLQVESPFETIQTFANNHKIKMKIIESDNLEEALNTFSQLHQHSNVILTGKSSLSRLRRDAGDQQIEGGNSTSYAFGEQCAAFFDSIYYIDLARQQSSTFIPLINTNSSFSCSGTSLEQVLAIDFKQNSGLDGASIQRLTLKFRPTNNTYYYVLDSSSIELNNSKTHELVYMGTPYGMETPVNYSFVCTKTTFKVQNKTKDGKSNSKVWIYIQKLQLQPTGVQNNNTEYTFGRVNYCQGFFSSGIWMAITSSLILAFILAFGIALLMNVKTMDKFDDPKGKPLNIGAEK
ncbi:V-type proton ATPase subunit [Brachionus plicatilis]|uniref:V-type proton ATPase subunit n=1 Tax=Brachionus plicatilis TaxID=10195 RepID=A0A3M7R1P4_BRAPC|nr:V-type proton ATPase subunit [Brachionus plicatilis]